MPTLWSVNFSFIGLKNKKFGVWAFSTVFLFVSLSIMRKILFIARFALVAMLAALSLQTSGQALYLDSHKAVQDRLSGTWLCSVPDSVFGTDWAPVLMMDSTWRDLVVDGQRVPDGGLVTFHDVKGGKAYAFTAMAGDVPVAGNITFTWLPVMELTGDFGYDYTEGIVSINSLDSTGKENMRAKLKWRGNLSNTDGKHKRNYSIKFLDKNGGKKNRSFFGLRKDNHWKLDGGQTDPLRIRNRVTADLWLDMSRTPWFIDRQLDAINGSRGRMTEVILNGEYMGLYNMMEPVDRKQLGLVKYDTVANVFHGQQWCVKHWCRTGTMSQPTEWSNDSSMWDGIEVSYPDFEDVHPTDWTTLANAIMFFKQTDVDDLWVEHDDSLDVYFDMPVMQDYFIFIVAMQLIDNESKNLYYSVWDRNVDRRLTMTPWDLDKSVGARSISSLPPEDFLPERPLNWISHMPMYAMYHISKRNRRQMTDRYWQLRQTWLNTDSLVARFRRAVGELVQCGAVAREEARWSGDSDLNGNVLDINGEMDYIDDWIHRRMAYLDQNVFARLTGDVNDDGEVNIADVNQVIDAILSGKQNTACDVNGDDEVNINDVNLIIGIILK